MSVIVQYGATFSFSITGYASLHGAKVMVVGYGFFSNKMSSLKNRKLFECLLLACCTVYAAKQATALFSLFDKKV